MADKIICHFSRKQHWLGNLMDNIPVPAKLAFYEKIKKALTRLIELKMITHSK